MNSNADFLQTIWNLIALNLSFLTVAKEIKTKGFIHNINEIISELLNEKCFTCAWMKSSKMVKSVVYLNLKNSEILENSIAGVKIT